MRKKLYALFVCGAMMFSNLTSVSIAALESDHDHSGYDESFHVEDESNSDDTIKADEWSLFQSNENLYQIKNDEAETATIDNQVESSGPTIIVTKVEGGHGNSAGTMFCEAPTVTITDSISITKVEVTSGGTTETFLPNASSFDVTNLTGKTGSVTISATNENNQISKVTFYISHILGTRQSIDVPANCTEPQRQIMVYICALCGTDYQHITSKVPNGTEALGHQLEDQNGKQVCSRCGYVEVSNDPDHQHSFGEYVVSKEATCTEEGSKYRECKCGYREVKTIAPTGHSFSEYKVIQEPDCATSTPGYQERECSKCHVTERQNLPYNHTWSDRIVRTEATCKQTGETGKQCTKCGTWNESSIVITPMLPHTWVDDDNDCTTPKVCSVCETKDVTSYQHSLVYKYDEKNHWQECQNEGCQFKTSASDHTISKDQSCITGDACTTCGWVEPGSGAHNIKWIVDALGHYGICQNAGCNYQTEVEAHAGVDDGDCTTPVNCSVCGYIYIAAKSHTPVGFWTWNNEGHYRHCRDCDQIVIVAHYGNDDGDCTTPLVCEFGACAYVIKPAQTSHNFSGSWQSNAFYHYHVCMNPDCDQKGNLDPHHGGMATCKTQAICDVCGSSYGILNANNHVGATEIRGYVEPTTSTPGYTGDTYCLDCDKKIADGTEIPVVEHEHKYSDNWSNDGVSHWKECTICGARSDQTAHTFGDWNILENEHMRECRECGYVETEGHISEQDDNNCETALICEVCKAVLVEAKEHNFTDAPYYGSEERHYRKCANQGCEVDSEIEEHSGGKANCESPAICEICGTSYGEKDPNNHVGKQEVRGYKDPSDTEPGYTGDIYCLSCNQIIAKGQEIPAGEREHDWMEEFDATGHWQACSRCGIRKEDSYAKHDWQNGVITTAPTCTTPGVRTYSCTYCDYEKTEVEPTIDHNLVLDTKSIVEATCGAPGYTGDQICTICNNIIVHGEVIPATGFHTWVDDNDCTTPLVCSVCGAIDSYVGEHALKYFFNETGHWQQCTKEGCDYQSTIENHVIEKDDGYCTTADICEVCGWQEEGENSHQLVLKYSENGHYWQCVNSGCTYKSQMEAHAGSDDGDCTTPVTCDTCGYEYIKAKEHNLSNDLLWNEEGHYKTCLDCNKVVFVGNHEAGDDDGDCMTAVYCEVEGCQWIMIPAETSHNFSGEWKSDPESFRHYQVCANDNCEQKKYEYCNGRVATCVTLATCDTCGQSYGDYDRYNHEVALERKSDGTYHWEECSACKAQINIELHTWDEGEITREPTCITLGTKIYTCTVCRETKTEEIAALGHTPLEERQNVKEATCGEPGYTGDILCKVCGEVIESGKEIPATGKHTWDEGVITVEPTETSTGVKTYTCVVCGEIYETTLNMLPVESDDTDNEYRIVVEEGITYIPETLVKAGLNTVEKIENCFKVAIKTIDASVSDENIVIYDIQLMMLVDGKWVVVDESNFPANGLTIVLPYPEGTSKDTHNFIVAHMFVTNTDEHQAGKLEYPFVTKTAEGLLFKVSSLSPIAIAYSEIVDEKTPTKPDVEDPTQQDNEVSSKQDDVDTSDYTMIEAYATMLTISGIGLIMLKKRKEENTTL